MTSPDPHQPAGTDEALIDARCIAKKLACSERTVYRLADAGQMPWGLRLGALRRWRAVEFDQWVRDGCPPVRKVGVK